VRHINQKGLDLIKHFEGLYLEAYKCPAGVWTIGYGHTGSDVYEGLRITATKADSLLDIDLNKAEACVDEACPMGISNNMFSALVSFVFNVGEHAFLTSTLYHKITAGDLVGAKEEFKKWKHANGKELEGLKKRREAEADLFAEVTG